MHRTTDGSRNCSPQRGNGSIDPAAPRILHARVVANLPWVADAMCPALTRFVDALIAGVPFRTLTFAEDASFVPVIERFLDSEAGHGTR